MLSPIGYRGSEDRLVLQLATKLALEYKTVGTLIQQGNLLSYFVKECTMLDLEQRTREENEHTELFWWLAENSSAYTIAPHHGSGGRCNAGNHSGGGKGNGKGKKN